MAAKSHIGNVCFDKELNLLSEYKTILESLIKIEEELTTLRKTSKAKINYINEKGTDKNSSSTLMGGKLENSASSFLFEAHEYASLSRLSGSDCNTISDLSSYSRLNDVYNVIPLEDNYLDFEDFPETIEDRSLKFAQRLNDLYAHLVNRYIEEEKLLDKYFNTARNIREKNTINLVKNELIKIKSKKNYIENSSSAKKKQRALLVRLQHEYNEIKLMRNFQKKLSEDRRKNLFKQLKRLCMSTEQKCIDSKVYYRNVHRKYESNRNYPLKCYDVLSESENKKVKVEEDHQQNCKKNLNNVLQLHLDLKLNMAALNSITHRHPHSQTVSQLKQISNKATNKNNTKSDNVLLIDERVNKIESPKISIDTIKDVKKVDINIESIDLRNDSINRILCIDLAKSLDLFVVQNYCSNNLVNCNDNVLCYLLYKYFRDTRDNNVTIAKLRFKNVFEKLCIVQNELSNLSADLSVKQKISCLFNTLISLVRRSIGSTVDNRALSFDSFNQILKKLDNLDRDCISKVMSKSLMRINAVVKIDGQKLNRLTKDVRKLEVRKGIVVSESGESSVNSKCGIEEKLCTELVVVNHEKNLREKFVSCTTLVYEELKKKQLAVEMEIKALLEQENTQIPYFLVREIPDKPPPPYIPPSDDLKPTEVSSTEQNLTDLGVDQIESIVKVCFEHIWVPFLSKSYSSVDEANLIFTNNQVSVKNYQPYLIDNIFLFDLCNELFILEYRDLNKQTNLWDYRKYYLPLKRSNICKNIQTLVKQYLGYGCNFSCKEDYVNYAHKAQYHVDELLTKELQAEENEWVNIEEHISLVKNMLTESILDSLISDTVNEYRALY